MLPPAPSTLSITSACPHMSPSFGASRRERKSGALPGGAGTITRIGLDGYACPHAAGTPSAMHINAATTFIRVLLPALVEALARQGRCDVHLLDVDGAAGDAPAPGIAQALLHREFLAVAVGAHELQRRARHLAHHLVGEALADRPAAAPRQPGAPCPDRAVDQQARRIDLHRHLREAQLHRLEIDDALAELLALLHVR